MNTQDIMQNLVLNFYCFDEKKQIFINDYKRYSTLVNLYEYSAENIRIIKLLLNNSIDFIEDEEGNIKLIA